MNTSTLLFSLATVISAVACSSTHVVHQNTDGTAPIGSPNGAAATNDAAPFTVRVTGGYRTSMLGAQSSPSTYYAVLTVEIENAAAPDALLMDPVLLSVETDANLVIAAAVVETTTLTDSCKNDIAVAAGGTAHCDVAFAIPAHTKPALLHYRGGPATTSAEIAGTTVDDICGLPAKKNNHCNSCIVSDACAACLAQDCCATSVACRSNPACAALSAAAAACADATCVKKKYDAATPAAQMLFDALVTCLDGTAADSRSSCYAYCE
jgi:hypothetical protein